MNRLSVAFVGLACGNYHVDILGLWQIQLETVSALVLYNFEPGGVFGDVAVQKVAVDMQQIMH